MIAAESIGQAVAANDGSRVPPIVVSALFGANRIASNLEMIASLAGSARFVLTGDLLDDVRGVAALALRTWVLELAASPQFACSTEALREEATAIFNDLRCKADVDVVATRARAWSQAVRGWALCMEVKP